MWELLLLIAFSNRGSMLLTHLDVARELFGLRVERYISLARQRLNTSFYVCMRGDAETDHLITQRVSLDLSHVHHV